MCCALNHSQLTLPLVSFVHLLFLQDIGNQTIAEISVEEGKDVKLSCTSKKISDANYLYWYRQASRNTPAYILYSIAGKDYMSPDFPNRFSSNVDKTNEDFELSIVNVLIGDSAVYYCGKEPTLLPSYGDSVQKLQLVVLLLNRQGAPLHKTDFISV
uniref:Ig-like domain-containing protein n=1 Tax=Callorhinchus milii TaxID=7868 RepID=A0A4W3IEI1_CALMI